MKDDGEQNVELDLKEKDEIPSNIEVQASNSDFHESSRPPPIQTDNPDASDSISDLASTIAASARSNRTRGGREPISARSGITQCILPGYSSRRRSESPRSDPPAVQGRALRRTAPDVDGKHASDLAIIRSEDENETNRSSDSKANLQETKDEEAGSATSPRVLLSDGLPTLVEGNRSTTLDSPKKSSSEDIGGSQPEQSESDTVEDKAPHETVEVAEPNQRNASDDEEAVGGDEALETKPTEAEIGVNDSKEESKASVRSKRLSVDASPRVHQNAIAPVGAGQISASYSGDSKRMQVDASPKPMYTAPSTSKTQSQIDASPRKTLDEESLDGDQLQQAVDASPRVVVSSSSDRNGSEVLVLNRSHDGSRKSTIDASPRIGSSFDGSRSSRGVKPDASPQRIAVSHSRSLSHGNNSKAVKSAIDASPGIVKPLTGSFSSTNSKQRRQQSDPSPRRQVSSSRSRDSNSNASKAKNSQRSNNVSFDDESRCTESSKRRTMASSPRMTIHDNFGDDIEVEVMANESVSGDDSGENVIDLVAPEKRHHEIERRNVAVDNREDAPTQKKEPHLMTLQIPRNFDVSDEESLRDLIAIARANQTPMASSSDPSLHPQHLPSPG